MNETNDKFENAEPKKKKKVFKNFAEYWHFIRYLSEEQRKLIANSLPISEQKSLRASYERGGWEWLFMRNSCDQQLDYIKQNFGIDLLAIRFKVLNDQPQLMQKSFWKYVNSCFDRIPWEHIAYIFDGVVTEDYDESYVKLSKYKGSE